MGKCSASFCPFEATPGGELCFHHRAWLRRTPSGDPEWHIPSALLRLLREPSQAVNGYSLQPAIERAIELQEIERDRRDREASPRIAATPTPPPAPCPVAGCASRCATRSNTSLCAKHGQLGRTYGLTNDQLIELLERGRCEACGSTESLSIDHDHACCRFSTSCGGCVRGLLCRGCNWILGRAQDDQERLRSLADYLGKSRTSLAA